MALISFDLDGVLQRNPFQGGRPDGVFGHIRRELAPFTGLSGLEAEEAALKLVYGEHKARLNAGQMVAAFDWDDIVVTVGKRIGYTGKMDVAALVTHYAKNPELCWSYPGAAECLETLTAQGHTLITVTNGFRCYQEPVLRQLGLLQYFQAMVSPEVAGAAKPQVEIFKAAEAYGPAPRIHVGDTLPHDVAGAKRAGWKAVYLLQMKNVGATELPAELAALPPAQRPIPALEWLRFRLEKEKRVYTWPPAELEECIPDAIAVRLDEVPEAVAALVD